MWQPTPVYRGNMGKHTAITASETKNAKYSIVICLCPIVVHNGYCAMNNKVDERIKCMILLLYLTAKSKMVVRRSIQLFRQFCEDEKTSQWDGIILINRRLFCWREDCKLLYIQWWLCVWALHDEQFPVRLIPLPHTAILFWMFNQIRTHLKYTFYSNKHSTALQKKVSESHLSFHQQTNMIFNTNENILWRRFRCLAKVSSLFGTIWSAFFRSIDDNRTEQTFFVISASLVFE